MGTAVAATDIRGCREVIVDGETGVLFPLKDVEGFSAAVMRLLEDAAQRAALARAGQRRTQERYVEANVTKRIVELYRHGLSR